MNASSQADPPDLSQAVLRQVNAQLRQQLEQAELKIRVLEERLRLERIARYGKRSETLSDKFDLSGLVEKLGALAVNGLVQRNYVKRRKAELT